VDECEGEAARAFAVNAVAVRRLAETCRDLEATLVHFSTDYVFGGPARTPRVETDRPDPQSVYATSKLAGEHLVRATGGRHFVIRTCGLYGLAGASGKGGNFVETMLRLAREGRPIRVVADQVCTPTSTAELARTIGRLLRTDAYGLYHVTNNGQCSWYEFAERIFGLLDLHPDLAAKRLELLKEIVPKVAECIHIAEVFEHADDFDVIKNHCVAGDLPPHLAVGVGWSCIVVFDTRATHTRCDETHQFHGFISQGFSIGSDLVAQAPNRASTTLRAVSADLYLACIKEWRASPLLLGYFQFQLGERAFLQT
jgi:hypothetical protein